MLMPKKTKYRKQMTGKMRGISHRGASLDFGSYGLKAEGRGYITSRQIESARKVIAHHTKRGGKLWIRIFPAKPITKKPNETRMGSGKGAVDHYACLVLPGRILMEVDGLSRKLAHDALNKAAYKFPIKVRIVEEEQV